MHAMAAATCEFTWLKQLPLQLELGDAEDRTLL